MSELQESSTHTEVAGDNRELQEWVEKAAIENLKEHYASADQIAKDATTTLTVFLAAVGGGLAYAAKAIEQHSVTWLSAGAIAFTVWFLVLSLLLVWKCMMLRPFSTVYNEPRSLYQPQYSLSQLREAEFKNLQNRINRAAQQNGKVARWLNRLRLAAAACPVAFIVGAAVGWAVAGAAFRCTLG
ncbi:hypothetical protein [Paraburkholderia sp. SIMBA_027]|uniref:hypothetical protein n=1 Tax=Paraburkholderia sp. SIMBA_027 TaxID=3085770 RepID=UPI00397B11B8